MNFSTIFLFAVCLNARAEGFSQQISISQHDVALDKVFKEINRLTGYTFVYTETLLEKGKTVSISVDKGSLKQVLDLCFKDQPFNYTIINRMVVIKEKENRTSQKQHVYATVPPVIISGKVINNKGEPLQGVSVLISGSKIGTTTASDGRFELTVTNNENIVLEFSNVGFEAKSVNVGKQTALNITLEDAIAGLDQVVVVGYGTEKKVNVVGSISTVSSEKIERRPAARLTNALTGQMTGVTVIQRSGKPGADGNGIIRVRGVGSFGATPGALVLVDGIPGSLNELNPADIESVSVLKDASSAAIYGARSANGVILVTTKKGTQAKLKIGYTEYFGIEKPTEFPDMANSWEYAEMYNIAVGSNTFTPDVISKYKAMNDLDKYPNTNFLKDVFSKNGMQSGRNISISGGAKSNQYFLSAGMLNQKGLVARNDYKRYNIRLNMASELSPKISLTTRMAGSVEKQNEPLPIGARGGNSVEDGIVTVAARWGATWLGKASNGDYGLGQSGNGTPVSWLASNSYRRRPITKVSLSEQLNYTPIKSLVLSIIGGYNYTGLEERRYKGSQQLTTSIFNPIATLYQDNTKIVFQTVQALAEYSKEYKAHNFRLLTGYSFEKEATQLLSAFRQDFPSNNYTVLDIGGPNNQQANGNDVEWAIQSFFGRFKYSFNDKYLFESTVRRDGSSRFPSGQKYGTFPSLAAGWRLSKEAFFESASSWISNLKLKASWGILGNQNIGNYPYQSTLSSGRDYAIGTGMSTGAAYTNYKDQNIHWESTRETDAGIESDFLQGKLTFNLTYFNRNTYDVLYTPSNSVSSVLGVNMSEINTGKVRNAGWEVELGYRNQIRDFHYQAQGFFSIINNKLTSLGLGNVTQPNRMVGNGSTLFIGYPIEMYYGYKTDGVFIDEHDISTWVNQKKVNPNKLVPGDIRYMDISGPNGVPDGVVDPTYDQTFLGSTIPKYNFSFSGGIQYKGFDFSALLQGVAGVKGRLDSHAGIAFYNNGTIQRWQIDERFNPQSPERYPKYPRLEVVPNGTSPNYVMSDFWALDASYLRIKNLQLGYTLPAAVLNRVPIERLRFSFSADNLYTFNKYPVGWDPEINSGGAFYPILATFTFAVNANF